MREVRVVKRTQHGIIADPYTIREIATLAEAVALMRAHRRRHAGGRRRRAAAARAADRRATCASSTRDTIVSRSDDAARAARRARRVRSRRGMPSEIMLEHKIKKLPLVDADGTLLGLVTAKDLIKQRAAPVCDARRRSGRLRVGAAIGATGDYLERAAELLRAGADVLVIDIAHGHSVVMARAIEAFRKRFGDVELIAGNVATAEGARFLIERGVNGDQGRHRPGRRLHDAPQRPTSACRRSRRSSRAARRPADRVPLIADGGIKPRRRHRAGAAVRRRHA